jgi:fluoride exporter
MTLALVLLGGAVGAPTRYLTDVAVQRLHRSSFPWGTWTVNVVGSLILGLVAAGASSWLETLVGTGFCGALTTFSTFGYETVRLADEGETAVATANVAASLTVGLLAAALGWWLGSLAGI